MKNRVYRNIGIKGNIGKQGKLCCGNENEDLKIVVTCMVLNTPV